MIAQLTPAYIYLLLLGPGLTSLILGLTLIFDFKLKEEIIYKITAFSTALVFFSSIIYSIYFFMEDSIPSILHLGDWFKLGDYKYSLDFHIDSLSIIYLLLTGLLCSSVVKYSRPYLHRESGFHRFFLMYNLFLLGLIFILIAGSVDFLFIGWEMVGITSVLLIAFFYKRKNSLHNSYRALAVYKFCDVGILALSAWMHFSFDSSEFHNIFHGTGWPNNHLTTTGIFISVMPIFIILGSMGKSAQFPLTIWPAGAMEGPTPSSTIFYGSLSVHLGPFLLLRFFPILENSPWSLKLIIIIGFITAIYASGVGRSRSDAKTCLAYSTVAQVGIIFIEIGLGFQKLALFHVCAHSCMRTLQFLRASSLIQDFLDNPLIYEGMKIKPGSHIERIFPLHVQKKLYLLSINYFGLHSFLEDFLAKGLAKLFTSIRFIEDRISNNISSTDKK